MSLPSSYRSRRGHIHLPRVLPLVGCRFKTPTTTTSTAEAARRQRQGQAQACIKARRRCRRNNAGFQSCLDLSIFRVGLKKNSVISGRKNPAHDHPTRRVGLQFSGRAQAEPGLGRAARVFYSVKQLRTTFQVGLGQKKFREIQDLYLHPSSKIRGRAWLGPGQRTGLKMLTYNHVILIRKVEKYV
jgi:hypothetical protein